MRMLNKMFSHSHLNTARLCAQSSGAPIMSGRAAVEKSTWDRECDVCLR